MFWGKYVDGKKTELNVDINNVRSDEAIELLLHSLFLSFNNMQLALFCHTNREL